jgi:hypothetical protein
MGPITKVQQMYMELKAKELELQGFYIVTQDELNMLEYEIEQELKKEGYMAKKKVAKKKTSKKK